MAGLRFALEPGRGRTAVPVRSVMAGALLAIMVVTATLTFGASLTTLISHPALYGWNFSYALYSVDGYGPLPASWTGPLLARDRAVAATAGVYFETVQVDGQTVPAMAAPVNPRWPRGPVRSRAPGPGPDRARPGHSGPAAQAGRRHAWWYPRAAVVPRVRLRIAGTAALPAIGDVLGVHASMSTGAIVATCGVMSTAALDRVRPCLRA